MGSLQAAYLRLADVPVNGTVYTLNIYSASPTSQINTMLPILPSGTRLTRWPNDTSISGNKSRPFHTDTPGSDAVKFRDFSRFLVLLSCILFVFTVY